MADPADLRARLANRWQGRSPKDIANQFAAPLYGTPGEWDLPRDVTPKRELLYLAVGIPDAQSLPKTALTTAATNILQQPGDLALRYGFGQGPEGIRRWLAEKRSAEEGFAVDEHWYQLTNGSSGAIDLIARSLINPGDVIIAESPTYMGTLHNFRGVGAEVHSVPIDEQGMQTDALAGLLAQLRYEGKRVRLIYTISAFQNPSGAVLSFERRKELLELACEYDAIVLDDEAYRELWFDEPPPPALSALADGWGVITVGTFSKTLATGIRVGYIHAHPELLALFSRMRFAMGQNQFGLRAVGEFLARDLYAPHVRRVRSIYQHKRDSLHAAMLAEGLDEFLDWSPPAGGFYLWARLRAQPGERLGAHQQAATGANTGVAQTLEALWRTGIHEGIAVNNGAGFTLQGEAQHLRIAYPWTPEHQFPEAARRLRVACERVAGRDSA